MTTTTTTLTLKALLDTYGHTKDVDVKPVSSGFGNMAESKAARTGPR